MQKLVTAGALDIALQHLSVYPEHLHRRIQRTNLFGQLHHLKIGQPMIQ
jgi:hypothetical protein